MNEMDLNLCRICLKGKKKLVSIFECQTNFILTNFIKELTTVEIRESDLESGFPTKICNKCIEKLNVAHEIKKTCIQSDRCLKLKFIFNTDEFQDDQEITVEAVNQNELFNDNATDDFYKNLNIPEVDSIEPDVQIKTEMNEEEDFKIDQEFSSMEDNVDVDDGIDNENDNRDPDFDIDKELELETTKKKRPKKGTQTILEAFEKSHQCTYCGKVYLTASHLKYHELIHTNVKNFACDICNKRFLMKYYLTKHMKIHLNERSYKCPDCPKRFNTSASLNCHIRLVHSDVKKFQCTFCPKKFPLKHQLNSHNRTHTGEKPHACTICDKKYSHKVDLKRHIMLHTGKKPYKCPYCDRTFTKKSNMECHIPTHTGEKPYKCAICFKEFRQPCPYKKHLKQHEAENTNANLNTNQIQMLPNLMTPVVNPPDLSGLE